MAARPPVSLKARALQFLAAREHSPAELARKLARGGEPAEDISAVLSELQARGLLSTERYIESVVHRRAAGRGTARLRQELLAQGVDAAAARDALAPLQDSEAARGRALWLRRFGTVANDPRERARQARFLLSRGFRADLVRLIVGGQFGQDETDADDSDLARDDRD